MGFYGSNDPTNSVKALKEDVQGLGLDKFGTEQFSKNLVKYRGLSAQCKTEKFSDF